MSGIAGRLAEVLAVHLHRGTSGRLIGTYGITVDDFADALLPVVEREIAAARGEALREAADVWQAGAGFTLMLRNPTGVPAIDYAQRVLDWLRDRAALSPDPRPRRGGAQVSDECRCGQPDCGWLPVWDEAMRRLATYLDTGRTVGNADSEPSGADLRDFQASGVVRGASEGDERG